MRHVSFIRLCCWTCLGLYWVPRRCWWSVHVSIGSCKGSSLEIEGSPCSWDYSSSKFWPLFQFLCFSLFPRKWPTLVFRTELKLWSCFVIDWQQHWWSCGLQRVCCSNSPYTSDGRTRLWKVGHSLPSCFQQIWSGWWWIHHARGA